MIVKTTEIWNGSSWATTTALAAVKSGLAGCGRKAPQGCHGGRELDYLLFLDFIIQLLDFWAHLFFTQQVSAEQ